MQIISYAGSSGRLEIEFNAHEFLALGESLEKLFPQVEPFFTEPKVWFELGSNCKAPWAKFCTGSADFAEFIELINNLDSTKYKINRKILNPLHVNCLYQLVVGGSPIKCLPEVGLLLIGMDDAPAWLPMDYKYATPIPLSQLREEGIDLFDREVLIERLKKERAY